MTGKHTISVEVVFALGERQQLVSVNLAPGITAIEAIEACGMAGKFPDQDFSACRLGIWGRLVDETQVLQDGDRVEIYRPLNIDPRDARRRLAAEGKSMGGLDALTGPAHKDP